MNVVFDTNMVFNKGFEDLIPKPTADLIARHSAHGDLAIRWIIPHVVAGEREYQMRNEYREVSSTIAKARLLFGNQWEISQAHVEQRIGMRINEQLAAHGIEVARCDTGLVDWDAVIRRSWLREPPFQSGNTEKGFRDAIVCETFIQIAQNLPASDSAVLVSNDRLVRSHLQFRGVLADRVRVADTLDALNDEIRLRVSHVDAETQALIERHAKQLFLPDGAEPEDNCLWYRENLFEEIQKKFGDRIRLEATSASRIEHDFVGHTVTDPRLVSKEGQRVHFESLYDLESSIRVWVEASPRAESEQQMLPGLIQSAMPGVAADPGHA
jgi:hypothetical protein